MKRTLKRVFILSLCLALTITFVPRFSVSTFAAQSGNQNYTGSASTDFNVGSTTIRLNNAATVSGDTITYVADRAYHSSLADLGDVYSVNFSANGIKVNTSIAVSNYAISDYGIRNDAFITDNGKVNKSASVDHNGHFVGDLPAVGSQISFTMTSSITDTYYYSGYYLDYSTSKTVTIIVKCVDSTPLKEILLKSSGYVESCWTPETWAPFAQARDTANSVIGNANSTQTQIDDAFAAINAAKKNLVHDGPITECEYCITGSTGSDTTGGIISLKNVSYGPDERNVMDIYLPKNMTGDCSMILYIHGGAWVGGDKDIYTSIAYADCAKYGLVTVAISHRYASASVNGNMIMDDVQASVAKSKEIAALYGLNLTKMMTTGASAGAHLAMLYAYSRRDVSPVTPVCVFDQCGPTNLCSSSYWNSSLGKNTISAVLSYMSGTVVVNRDTQVANADALLRVSPINYLATAVPTVICHGKEDATVNYNEATNLANSLWAQGTPCELISFPNSGHSLSSDPNYTLYANTRFEYLVNTYLYDSVPVQSHEYEAELVPMTCTSDGYVMYTCKDCGRYYVSDIVKAAHDPGAWEVVTPATVDSEGEEARICQKCGEIVETRAIEKLIPEEVPTITPKDGSDIFIDDENMIITGVEQGFDDIGAIVDCEDATVELVPTSKGTGTGAKVLVKSESTGEVVATYSIVISGDIDGDAYVDAFDVAVIGEYVNTFTSPDDVAYMKAADIFEDNYLDANDLAFLLYVANYEE